MIARYTRPEMGRIWLDENRYRAWLAVELAVCAAWAELGRVPAEAVRNLRENARIDVARIEEIEKTTQHDIIAFLTSLEEIVGEDARHVHLGCTSSDIVDTATALLVREAGQLILADLDAVIETLGAMARKYRGILCMGRTHGIHAEPTSFGLKIAGFYAEFKRHRERIAAALENMRVGKISGAVGTYAMLGPEVEKIAMSELGLEPDPHSTQIVQRDRIAHFLTALAILGGGIERLCVELRHLQRTELGEVEEGFGKGQKGSSAMPHKKNPISAENLCGLSRILRADALAALEDQALWHERDISHSSVERIILPDATILADYMLTRLNRVLTGLVVHADRMRENMQLTHGLYFSQRVLTALLGTGVPRQKAYEAVQRLAMRSFNERLSFPDLVRGDADMRKALGEDALREIFDDAWYLRHEDAVFERLFAAGNGENAG